MPPPPPTTAAASSPGGRRGRRARWALFAAAVVVNLATMYAPSVPDVQAPSGLRLDLVGHALSFGALTLTGLLAGLRPRLLIALVAVNAVASELIQHLLLPHRSGDVTDLAADAVGVVAGVVAWRWWCDVRARRRARPADARSGPRSSSRR